MQDGAPEQALGILRQRGASDARLPKASEVIARWPDMSRRYGDLPQGVEIRRHDHEIGGVLAAHNARYLRPPVRVLREAHQEVGNEVEVPVAVGG